MNDEIHLRKKALRKKIRRRKKNIGNNQRNVKSALIMKKVEDSEQFQKAKNIFIYWAMDDEVDTRKFITKWHKEKTFILPSVDGNDLLLKKFVGKDSLKNGELYDIPEPIGKPFVELNKLDLAIIPGVAFDGNNNRMGRGKAYYDKILRRIKNNTFLMGICYNFQFVDEVPIEEHDIKMDKVIYP